MRNIHTLAALLLAFPLVVGAQSTAPSPVQETELRTCLLAEKEGIARFNKLEQRATELKGTEKLLAQRRLALEERQRALDKKAPDPGEVQELNDMVRVFNDQTDQLNTDKNQFDVDVRANESWMNNTMKPACANVVNQPVALTTSFYACGYDKQGDLADLPHCKTLPNLDALKTCVKNAGSKSKAQDICNDRK